jgi:hypothetical protein
VLLLAKNRLASAVINPESEGKILEIVRNVKVQGEDRRVNHVYDPTSVKVH